MKYFTPLGALMLSATLSGVALGQETTDDAAKDAAAPDKPAAAATDDAGPPRGQRFRQRLLELFDEDKDGELSDAEREKAREFRRQRMEQLERQGPPPWPDRPGPGPRGRGPEGRPGGPPPGGPGFGFMPDPMRLFNAFDDDKDEKLSKEEFERLVDHMRAMRGPGRPDGPPQFGGPREPGRRGYGPDGRRGPHRRWDDGPAGRPGPPPQGDGQQPPADAGPEDQSAAADATTT